MKCKYKIGDKVVISKKFVRKLWGAFIDCRKTLATVVEICDTPTMGPAYSLEVGEVRLDICYWEEDIDGFYTKGSEVIWETWSP